MELEQSIAKATAQAVKSLYGIDVDADKIQIQKTKKEFQGDVTVVTFAFSKAAHKSPDAIGQEIGEYLKNNAKEVKRPLDKEELNQEREEKVAGGFCAATNTAAFNAAAVNTAKII